MARPCCTAAAAACSCGRCSEGVLWGDEAALWEVWRGSCGTDGLRSEPVLSEEPGPLLVHLFVLCVLARRVVLGGFWGVVSRRRSSAGGSSVGIESREGEGVSSDSSALVVVSEPVDALAWGWRWCAGGDGRRGRAAASRAALFGGGGLAGAGAWARGVPGSMSIDCPAVLAGHGDAGGRWARSSSPRPPGNMAGGRVGRRR